MNIGQVLPLGDSITYGLTTASTSTPGGYRTEFYNQLTGNGASFQYVGTTTDNPSPTLTAAGQTAHDGHPGFLIGPTNPYGGGTLSANLTGGSNYLGSISGTGTNSSVLLLVGVNDFRANVSTHDASSDLYDLVGSIFAAKPNTHVYLSTLVPYISTYAQDSANGDAVVQSFVDDRIRWLDGVEPVPAQYQNDAGNFKTVPQIVSAYAALGDAITLVNSYNAFLNGDGTVNSALYGDGLHPNAAGYTVLGDAFANAVLSSVPEPASLAGLACGGLLLARRRKAS